MPDERNSSPDDSDPLDELLTRAQWPEPTPLQLSRLESAWDRAKPEFRGVSPEVRSVRIWTRVASVAAILMLSLVVWELLPTSPEPVGNTPVVTKDAVIDDGLIDDGPQSPVPHVEQQPAKLNGVVSRPPTPLELALLQAAESTARQHRRFRETDPMEQAVARLMQDPEASVLAELLVAVTYNVVTKLIKDPQASVSSLVSTFDDIEMVARRAIAELPQARGGRRVALARLLVGIVPPDALPALLALWTDPTTRSIVEPTVVRLADVPTLASLIQARQSFDARVRLLTEIGSRPDREAQSLLIDAATTPFTRPAALAAARRAAPPSELLFSALAHPQANVRIAAALLLGEHSNPEVTARLVALARQRPNRSEPWIALLQRNDSESRQIVGEARQDPQIMASINLAEATRQLILRPVQVGVQL